MAQKKKSAGKKKSSASTKQSKPAPALPSYQDLIDARRAMEAAQAQVYQADLAVRRAYADHSDFKVRDANTAQARKGLNAARNRAAAATDTFHELQRKARAGK